MRPIPPHPARRPVLVTGASSGIGAAVAECFADAGHPVAVGARREDRVESLAGRLRARGAEVYAGRLDVTDDASVAAFVEGATAALGPVEILVCNAGRLGPGRIHETPPAVFADQIAVNLLGVQRLVHACVPAMVGRGRGDVVVVSSDTADVPRPWMAAYTAAKTGLEGMARTLRLELEGTGVRVGVVRPGPTITEMGLDWSADDTAAVIGAWGRFGLTRHDRFLPASAVADVVRTVATVPRGVYLPLVEVQPEPTPTRRPEEPVR